jgi:hypothetical protein
MQATGTKDKVIKFLVMFSKLFSPKKENQTKKEKWTLKEMNEALNIKWKDRICECCGGQEWSLSEHAMKHSLYNPSYSDKCRTSVLVMCDYCGNMKNFLDKNLFC